MVIGQYIHNMYLSRVQTLKLRVYASTSAATKGGFKSEDVEGFSNHMPNYYLKLHITSSTWQ